MSLIGLSVMSRQPSSACASVHSITLEVISLMSSKGVRRCSRIYEMASKLNRSAN